MENVVVAIDRIEGNSQKNFANIQQQNWEVKQVYQTIYPLNSSFQEAKYGCYYIKFTAEELNMLMS